MKVDFIFFDEEKRNSLVQKRTGEQKIAELISIVKNIDELQKCKSKFVILGIPEDIGVRANGGNAGAQTTWPAFLKNFLNFQANHFIKGDDICILGAFDFSEIIFESNGKDISYLKELTSRIDEIVFELILKIISAGKIPIVIGGGHNNAFPLLKAASVFYKKGISAINMDAHADLRLCDGRHSGNGFSYAKENSFLDKYYMLGLHENYNNQFIVASISSNPDFKAIYFEDLVIRNNFNIQHAFLEAKTFIDKNLCGIELDLDAIKNIQSSAQSPSGFAVEDARKYMHFAGSTFNFVYLHICEGIYELPNGNKDETLAKLITYMVSDFIKAYQNK